MSKWKLLKGHNVQQFNKADLFAVTSGGAAVIKYLGPHVVNISYCLNLL